ncbi:unnamed protein product [Owenia fusiformis]|uniref:Nucleotide-diphospho-sugar transferase domain-containing protein n=1 Tax=Owenia fusiformis TaxID=6347 RepID=A0A8S4PYC3_OWEFU|nr:unnamed protein product [Owenia fusiformis]
MDSINHQIQRRHLFQILCISTFVIIIYINIYPLRIQEELRQLNENGKTGSIKDITKNDNYETPKIWRNYCKSSSQNSYIYKSGVLKIQSKPKTNHKPILKFNKNSLFNQNLKFAYKSFSRTSVEISKSCFFADLAEALSNVHGNIVHMVSFDNNYIPDFLNWLIIARFFAVPPIDNILIITTELGVFQFIAKQDIPIVFLNPEDVIKDFNVHKLSSIQRQRHWVLRLITWRIINFLGYDVFSYDLDALPMKNLEKLLRRYPGTDLMAGAVGCVPHALIQRWHFFTLNMGALYLRANTKIDVLWDMVAELTETKTGRGTDQMYINAALYHLNITWKQSLRLSCESSSIRIQNELTKLDSPVESVTPGGLKVVAIPAKMFCRFSCNIRNISQYYIWHNPRKHQERDSTWLVNSDWLNITRQTPKRGLEWVRAITRSSKLTYLAKLYNNEDK